MRRRRDHGALNDRRHPLGFQDRHKRFADGQFRDGLLVSNSGFCRNVSAEARTAFWSLAYRRAERVNSVPELRQHRVRDIDGVLGDEIHADPLGADHRTTCSMRSTSAGGASSNNRCASSKKKTRRGRSRSPASGRSSNSSDNSHRRWWRRDGLCMSLSAAEC